MRLAIVGGGAAGFFLAIQVKELVPALEVTILERQQRVLAKVEVSGGGRCNCTNTFASVSDLGQVYPRGANLLKRLFRQFGPADAYRWFEAHGVPLTVQDDQCVFPEAQDSHAVINCFLRETRRLGVSVRMGVKVESLDALLRDFDFVAVTVGGVSSAASQSSFFSVHPSLTPPVPSLFTFSIGDPALTALMGVVAEHAVVGIPGTRFRTEGPLLITHWGMSGPAVLKLSSHAARHLAERSYQSPLWVNWIGESDVEAVRARLLQLLADHGQKLLDNVRPYGLQARLWAYLLDKAQLQGRRAAEVGKKGVNRLVNLLTNDGYTIAGRSPYRDEFVTCGGVSLDSVEASTLRSKHHPRLFFAGEVLDIDGVTGGFNFQAAWTTAYAAARGIAQAVENP